MDFEFFTTKLRFLTFALMNYQDYITMLDSILAPIYILIIVTGALVIQVKNKHRNPVYRYFLPGLAVKIVGAISVCLIYVFYYEEGGDTLGYYSSAKTFINLLTKSPFDFIKVWLGPASAENFFLFSDATGYPSYWKDKETLTLVKFFVPLEFIAFRGFITTSVLMALISYSGVWMLYLVFCDRYRHLFKPLAVTILFVPSVVFWGSGILKDSWTLGAVGWYCYSFYRIFIKRDRIVINSVAIILSSWVLISIKPYIFVALLPGSLIWGSWHRIVLIRNYMIRIAAVPFIAILGIGGGYFIWNMVSSDLGIYSSLDSMIQKAYITYDDLKQDYYQGNSFDLGNWDPTLTGILSKFPIAAFTGIFRPFIWEANNVVMFASGIENLLILLFSIWVLLRNPVRAFYNLFSDPMMLFCLIFAIFFAFSVAISTSNFGAMVRLRIPMLPFWLSGMVLIEYGRHRFLSKTRYGTVQ